MSGISHIDTIKSSVVNEKAGLKPGSSYITYCQVYEWYGYPFEKVIVVFEGSRTEEEEGFAYKFSEYDYDASALGEKKRAEHKHKYNPKLVQEFVDLAIGILLYFQIA
ncbi:MAG TPA: hypothetical protein VE619_02845 [Nitrososphaeraceae archaeon]|nr:hypothetical protein [Nitrososphaeraceae archaeon]